MNCNDVKRPERESIIGRCTAIKKRRPTGSAAKSIGASYPLAVGASLSLSRSFSTRRASFFPALLAEDANGRDFRRQRPSLSSLYVRLLPISSLLTVFFPLVFTMRLPLFVSPIEQLGLNHTRNVPRTLNRWHFDRSRTHCVPTRRDTLTGKSERIHPAIRAHSDHVTSAYLLDHPCNININRLATEN